MCFLVFLLHEHGQCSELRVYPHPDQEAVIAAPNVYSAKFRALDALPPWIQEAIAVLDLVPMDEYLSGVGQRCESLYAHFVDGETMIHINEYMYYALVYEPEW